VPLDSKAAERLSLAIHELTTNAVKHGALTNGTGRIAIEWTAGPGEGGGDELHLSWRESGVGIETLKPEREGFGMELLARSLPYDLSAETRVELTPTGLHFELRLPLNGHS
jgi:two-component sensor histidine kinase